MNHINITTGKLPKDVRQIYREHIHDAVRCVFAANNINAYESTLLRETTTILKEEIELRMEKRLNLILDKFPVYLSFIVASTSYWTERTVELEEGVWDYL